MVVKLLPGADQVADLLGDRAGHGHADDHDHQQHDQHQRGADLDRLELPDRPALLDLVDRVGGAREGRDVARGGVQRQQQADDEGHARRARALAARLVSVPVRMSWAGPGIGAVLRLSISGWVADAPMMPEHRDQRDQRREQRLDPVVGERRGLVGALVGHELLEGALEGLLLGGARELGGAVGRALGRRAAALLGLDRLPLAAAQVVLVGHCVLVPGQWPVRRSKPLAPPRSTAAFTSAKMAPCRAAAGSTSPQPYSDSRASGASSSPATFFQISLKIWPPSSPPSTPNRMPNGAYRSFTTTSSAG